MPAFLKSLKQTASAPREGVWKDVAPLHRCAGPAGSSLGCWSPPSPQGFQPPEGAPLPLEEVPAALLTDGSYKVVGDKGGRDQGRPVEGGGVTDRGGDRADLPSCDPEHAAGNLAAPLQSVLTRALRWEPWCPRDGKPPPEAGLPSDSAFGGFQSLHPASSRGLRVGSGTRRRVWRMSPGESARGGARPPHPTLDRSGKPEGGLPPQGKETGHPSSPPAPLDSASSRSVLRASDSPNLTPVLKPPALTEFLPPGFRARLHQPRPKARTQSWRRGDTYWQEGGALAIRAPPGKHQGDTASQSVLRARQRAGDPRPSARQMPAGPAGPSRVGPGGLRRRHRRGGRGAQGWGRQGRGWGAVWGAAASRAYLPPPTSWCRRRAARAPKFLLSRSRQPESRVETWKGLENWCLASTRPRRRGTGGGAGTAGVGLPGS